MFDLRSFVMSTLRGMSTVYPQWQVQEIALGYYAKGWINDADLSEIITWYVVPSSENESIE